MKKDSRWEYKDDFHEGLARVRTSEGKWALIDKTGKLLTPFQYSNIELIRMGLWE